MQGTTGRPIVNEQTADEVTQVYDRAYLLSPQKRNQVMALWEVRKYGADTFADPDYRNGPESLQFLARG